MIKPTLFFTKTFILTFSIVFLRDTGCEAQAQIKQLWGMTAGGGQYDIGTIFSTDSSGNNQNVEYNFVSQNEGARPKYTQLTQTSDGKLYGMSSQGGVNNLGILFQYDPATSSYVKKIDFSGTSNGSNPYGSLIKASDGKLYGMTSGGGVNNMGVLFQYDPTTSIYSKKLDFSGFLNGSSPHGSLIQGSDGKLYGMTSGGGINNLGVLFQYDPATSIYTKKLDFAGTTNGNYPYGSLIQANDGKLYGMTSAGGINFMGVLFQYDLATSTCTKKLDFSGVTNGSKPNGSLMQASDGTLYGMTYQGGINNMGVLFLYNAATSTYTKKLDFAGTTNGKYPYGSLMQASNGKLYGMTSEGGIKTLGVFFQYDPITSTYNKKLDFAGVNGVNPYGSLIQASDGKLYGMTFGGGAGKLGVLFQYDPSISSYTKKLDFEAAIDGQRPCGSLLRASDGKLYGMTSRGGTNGLGVLFQYDPVTSIYNKKLDFVDSANGSSPSGSLIQATDGKLYGMTYLGGTNDMGVLFQYDPITSTYSKKNDFAGVANGSNPRSLMQASDGKLYGATTSGGINGLGVLFQYNPVTSTFIKKLDFGASPNGNVPSDALIQASDGKLYGMTTVGGINEMGILFQYNPTTSTLTKKFEFTGTTNGGNPYGSLIQASDGKLYGMTRGGGTNSLGVLFQYDPVTSTYIKKLDFVGVNNGAYPNNSLIQSSNGKLYGMTSQGGANGIGIQGLGVLFQYDPVTSVYTKKLDFTGLNGSFSGSNMTEITVNTVGFISVEKELSLKLYPNPTHGLLTLELLPGNQKSATILIENIFGQVIYETQINTSIHHINTENYARGIYFVKVKTNDGTSMRKIIVE